MAFNDGKVVIKVEADVKNFDKAIKDAEKGITEVSVKSEEMKNKMGEAGQALDSASVSAQSFASEVKDTAGAEEELFQETASVSSVMEEAGLSASDAAETLGEISESALEASSGLQELTSASNSVTGAEDALQVSGDGVSSSFNGILSSSGELNGSWMTLQKSAEDLEKSLGEMCEALEENKTQTEKNAKATGDLGNVMNKSLNLQKFSTLYLEAAKAVVKFGKEVVKVCSELVDVYAVQEQAETRLEAINNAMGESVGYTTAQLKDMASALQGNSTFGDEIIMGAQKTLLALGTLNKEGFERALQASADLAAEMGTDIASAAQSLSQALLDPENGLRRLRTEGIAFTDAEKEQIKTLVEAGKTQEAQMLILDKVESKYKGMAKAIASTDTGKLKQISSTWGDIKENLGERVLDSVSPFLDVVLEKLNKIQEITKNSNNINDLMKGKTEFNDYSTKQLEAALEQARKKAEAQRKIADEHGAKGLGSSQYDGIIEKLEEELNLRKELEKAAEIQKKADEERQEQQARYNAVLNEQNEARSKANALVDANLREDEGVRLKQLIQNAKDAKKTLEETGAAYEFVFENGRKVPVAFNGKSHSAVSNQVNITAVVNNFLYIR